jgi:hypothetical protein
MRSVVVGGLALIALYALVQPSGVNAAVTGGNVLVSGLRRFLSPQVAGIPNKAGGK